MSQVSGPNVAFIPNHMRLKADRALFILLAFALVHCSGKGSSISESKGDRFPEGSIYSLAGPSCAERSDDCDVTITSLPATVSTPDKTYCFSASPTVTGDGAITVTTDNVKIVGPGRDADLTVPGITLTERRCVTLKNLRFSDGLGLAGGGQHRILNSRAPGGVGVDYLSSHNLIQDNIFDPAPAGGAGGFSGGSHHNRFVGNSISKTEDATHFGNDERFFGMAGTSDNVLENNTIEILNAHTASGGDILLPMYTVARTIFRGNTFRNMCDSVTGGYAVYSRDASTNNLFENNIMESSGLCFTVAMVSGAQPDGLSDIMFRNNRIYASVIADRSAVWLESTGPVNSFVSNVIAADTKPAVITFGVYEGNHLNFVNNTVYSGAEFAFSGGLGGSWFAKNNIFAAPQSSDYGTSFGAPQAPNLTCGATDAGFVNPAVPDFSLTSGSPAIGVGENRTDLGALQTVADTTAPSTPSGVTATARPRYMPVGLFATTPVDRSVILKWDLSQEIRVSWSPSTDNRRVAAYRILRTNPFSREVEYFSESAGTRYLDPTTGNYIFEETTFIDAWAPMGDTYTYRIQAIDLSGNFSAPSDPVSITLSPDTGVAGLTYRVHRKWNRGNSAGADWDEGTDTPNRFYTDTAPADAATVVYRISVLNSDDTEGQVSLAAGLYPDGRNAGDTTPPPIPQYLTAKAASGSQINLSWEMIGRPADADFDNVTAARFRVYRALAGSDTYSFVREVLVPSTSDTELSPNTTYSYKVTSVDAAGNESALSAAISATTTDGPPPPTPTPLPGRSNSELASANPISVSGGCGAVDGGGSGALWLGLLSALTLIRRRRSGV
ncbi:MAG: hypothetical protein V1798_02575 [Pseudomonadota bacterium]